LKDAIADYITWRAGALGMEVTRGVWSVSRNELSAYCPWPCCYSRRSQGQKCSHGTWISC